MQVMCPQCNEIGLLQTINTKHHRIRHTIKLCKNRAFYYHRVDSVWAKEQFNAEKHREEEYRKILGIK
jgi:hypothetical protein